MGTGRLGDPPIGVPIQAAFSFAGAEAHIAFRISGSALVGVKHRGGDHATLDLIGEVTSAGVPVRSLRDQLRIPVQGRPAFQLSEPFNYDAAFRLAPGTYTFRFLVRVDETGELGTYITTFLFP